MANPFLGGLDFLNHTIKHWNQPATEAFWENDFCQFAYRANGVLSVKPHQSEKPPLILSAGIHGNETLPIEWLNLTVMRLINDEQTLSRPVLFVLGNPKAMSLQQRFESLNLNRLFCGEWRNQDQSNYETRRAELLENVISGFYQDEKRFSPKDWLHLDLHTAIRGSFREKFAVYPFVKDRTAPEYLPKMLKQAGVESLLLMHKEANTFSSYTSRKFGMESLTIELGKVKPFGQNSQEDLVDFNQTLLGYLAGNLDTKSQDPEIFCVDKEIIHCGEGFELNLSESGFNFTEYPPETWIWKEHNKEKGKEGYTQWIVFPNTQVPKGQRAGLILRKSP